MDEPFFLQVEVLSPNVVSEVLLSLGTHGMPTTEVQAIAVLYLASKKELLTKNQIKLLFYIFINLKFKALFLSDRVSVRIYLHDICKIIKKSPLKGKQVFLNELCQTFSDSVELMDAMKYAYVFES